MANVMRPHKAKILSECLKVSACHFQAEQNQGGILKNSVQG